MLDALFKPRSIAVIGASTKELSIGNVIIHNLQHYGYKGAIYPINPSAPDVRGIKAYPNLAAVPGEIDLAHIIIPSRFVPQAMEECGEKGIKAVIINSAGFKEMGEEGARLQEAFLATAKKYGIRVFGPNCQGIINTDPDLKAYCNFTFTFPRPGFISVVALSGGVGALIMQGLADLGIGMRMYASNGNACDVSISDILSYWGEDPLTKAIVLYTEGVSDAKQFLDVAKRVATRKPLLAMMAGRTEQGAKAASSHTGALAGAGKITELIFEKAGILSFQDEGEMVRAAMAFASQPIPAGNRVGIITNTGGPAVIATDVLVAAGLDVPVLSGPSIARLRKALLPQAAVENPVDVVATASGAHFRAALDVLMDESGVDSIFINFVTPPFSDTGAIARQIVEVNRLGKKPIVCNFMTNLAQERFRMTGQILQEGGVPCYANPSDAARALGALARYGRLKRRGGVEPSEPLPRSDSAKARAVIARNRKSGRTVLSAADVYAIFEAYGIAVAPWRVVETAADAVLAAEAIGYPVVVKVDSEQIDHKSDMGGVVVNLTDAAAVRSTIETMRERFRSFAGLRFLVQKFLPNGRELIIGATADDQLGHLVMFGLGGIYVELLQDVVFKLAPITRTEAAEMLKLVKLSAVLDGVRGQAGVNKESVQNIILRVSNLLLDLPMIEEMDINPVMAFADTAFAVDGRIRILASGLKGDSP